MLNTDITVSAGTGSARHAVRIDGEVVASLEVVYRSIRVGCATVRMGGIAGVGTEPQHRNQGLARQLLEHTNQWMTKQGFDCAILFGIPDFYYRFGYATCLVDSEFVIATRDAEQATRRLIARPYEPSDSQAVLAIHNSENGERTGCIVRHETERLFRHGSRWPDRAEAWVFCDASGKVCAYAAHDVANTYVTVCEVGASEPTWYGDVLRWAVDLAVELRCGEVRFMVPEGHPFVDYAAQFGGRQSTTYPLCRDGMGRVLNVAAFLEAIAPELARRARRVSALPGTVVLHTDIGSAEITWDGQTVNITPGDATSAGFEMPQSRLMQLAMGYHSARTIASMPDVMPGVGLDLLDAFFPRTPGYMWLPDHF